MSAITWQLAIDWSNNGVFTGTGEDVTARSLNDSPITVQAGRDVARAQSPVSPGQAIFGINNSSKDYSPNNGSSPIAGLLLPGRGCFLKATHLAVTYVPFQGYLDAYDVDMSAQDVKFTAVDLLARLAGVNISTTLKRGIRAGEAIGFILDEIGWAGGRDLDSGTTIFPYWWEEGTDAFEALQKVLKSEGPPAIAFVAQNGNFTFRDRTHRLTDTLSVTSQATFKDSGADTTGSVMFNDFDFDTGWRDVVNLVQFAVEERKPTTDDVVIWEDESLVTIAASGTEVIEVMASDPFQDAIVPEQDTDYQLLAGTVTPTLSQTSGQGTILTLTAGGGGATVSGLQIRATSIPVFRTRTVTASDSTSQANYGVRSWPDEAPFAGINDAKAMAPLILNLRKDKREIISVGLDGGNADTVLVQQLGRSLSDRVTITETQTVTNADYYIERIEHEISDAGGRLRTTFRCERAGTTLDNPSTVFIIGTSVIGTGVLGR